ncbi:MAG: hypothetical protein HY924_07480 [Elusimicrobia bacterium]|nr:hypothetical protein [Elusimicrobiota bacterium]
MKAGSPIRMTIGANLLATAALLLLAVSVHAQERRSISETGWDLADPPDFDFVGGVCPKWKGKGGLEGGTIEVCPVTMDAPLQPEHCGEQEVTHAFDSVHPTYTTVAYFCGESFLRYLVQLEFDPGSEERGTPPWVRVLALHFRSGGRPIKKNLMGFVRSVLAGLGSSVHVPAASAPRGSAAGPTGEGSAPAVKPRSPRPATWRALAAQAVEGGGEELVRGDEAGLFGVKDPAAVKVLPLDGGAYGEAGRKAMVLVRLGKDGQDIEPFGILLKTVLRRGRQAENRYFRLALDGTPRRIMVETEALDGRGQPVPGSAKKRKVRLDDARAEVWLELEALAHLGRKLPGR